MKAAKILTLLFLLITVNYNPAFSQEKTPIVFVHGLFNNGKVWEDWQIFFESKGYETYAPSYPFHEGDPALLRKEIHDSLPKLNFWMAYDAIEKLVESLPSKPIIIGHSMGGLIMQKLMEREKIEMGIALAPANPRGISINDWTYISNNFRMVNPLKRRNRHCMPPMKWFNKTFFNNLTDEEAQKAFDEYFIPESRIIAKSSFAKGTEIKFNKPHRPMLFISGENDQDLPPKLIQKNFLAYYDSGSIKAYHEFPNRSHFIVNEKNWEEVAEYVWVWIEQNQISSEK